MLKIVVRECMVTTLVTFRQETPVYEAIEQILKNRISGAPVVDDHRQILGMFSESDALRAILKMAYHKEEVAYSVGEFMATTVDTIHEETGLVDVASEFIKHGRRRLPVVNDEGILVGQVSRRDILRTVNEYHQRANAE